MRFLTKISAILVVPFLIFSCSDSSNDIGTLSSSGEVGTGQGGSLARFAATNNSLYTVDWNTLKTFDISNATDPVLQNETRVGFDIETIFVRNTDGLIFMGSQRGMYIYEPMQSGPQFVSLYQHVFACDPVVANNEYAYVTLNSNANLGCGRGIDVLESIDIRNPASPSLIESYSLTSPKGLGLTNDDNRLYVCDDGLKVYNCANPANLELLYHFQNVICNDVIVKPNGKQILITVGDQGLRQYKIESTSLTLISTINIGS